jgi:hypothetical protein
MPTGRTDRGLPWQMDPKFLRNLKWSKRHNGKGRGADEE